MNWGIDGRIGDHGQIPWRARRQDHPEPGGGGTVTQLRICGYSSFGELFVEFGNAAAEPVVTSAYCQRQTGVKVQSLQWWNEEEQEWDELVVEDRHATPAEIATLRIDFWAWLASLPRRDRWIEWLLAAGEAVGSIAKRFGLTPGRISQMRCELYDSWHVFVADIADAQLKPTGGVNACSDELRPDVSPVHASHTNAHVWSEGPAAACVTSCSNSDPLPHALEPASSRFRGVLPFRDRLKSQSPHHEGGRPTHDAPDPQASAPGGCRSSS